MFNKKYQVCKKCKKKLPKENNINFCPSCGTPTTGLHTILLGLLIAIPSQYSPLPLTLIFFIITGFSTRLFLKTGVSKQKWYISSISLLVLLSFLPFLARIIHKIGRASCN